MTLPVFLQIEATPNTLQLESLQSYLSQVPKIVAAHGGVPVATYDVEHCFDAEPAAKVFAVVSFPNRQSIDAFFADPAYQAIVPLRDKGFSQLRFYVTTERI